jgi:glycerol-3-phosphate O-acyltransferase / dihydroxyacetone phosphate acyltransferase
VGNRLARLLLGILLDVFFRQVRRISANRVPDGPGILYVANHVNSLLDPLLMICRAPRAPRFLAKEPLFHHPLVAPFLRLLRALPVHRRQDEGSDPGKNRQTFAACVEALRQGESVALFPEGKSHSEPRLQPLKTGAARIVGLALASGVRMAVVPAGLHYSDRSTFRSDALLLFGRPVDLSGLPFEAGDEPEAVRELTARIEEGLEAVTVNAESFEDVELVDALIPVARELLPPSAEEAEEVDLRKAFLEGYYTERERHPYKVAEVREAVRAYREALRSASLRDEDLASGGGGIRTLAAALPGLTVAVLAYPPALYGFLFHFVPYTLVGPAVKILRPEPDVLGTYKLYGGMISYPIFYALQGWALAQVAGWGWAALALAAAVPCGLWALRYYEFRAQALRRGWASIALLSAARRARLLGLRAAVLGSLQPFLG